LPTGVEAFAEFEPPVRGAIDAVMAFVSSNPPPGVRATQPTSDTFCGRTGALSDADEATASNPVAQPAATMMAATARFVMAHPAREP